MGHHREPTAGKATYHKTSIGEAARGISRWRPSDGKGKVVGLYICTMRRYAPLQYQQVLLRAPTAALFYISNPTTASTFALACCDDFCQRRAKLYLAYCKRAFGKPQSGKSAQQARANAYFFRRSVACIAIPRRDPHYTNFCASASIRQLTSASFLPPALELYHINLRISIVI